MRKSPGCVLIRASPPILQNGGFLGRDGLEVEVGLQIGVILQVRAPPPKQKKEPPNNKGQTPYSSPIPRCQWDSSCFCFFLVLSPCIQVMGGSPGLQTNWLELIVRMIHPGFCRMGDDALITALIEWEVHSRTMLSNCDTQQGHEGRRPGVKPFKQSFVNEWLDWIAWEQAY